MTRLATRWYLRHDGRDLPPPPVPFAGLTLVAPGRVPEAFYRFLYAEVGRQWEWTDRLGWTDEQIRVQLSRPDVSITVVYHDGIPAGFFELVGSAGGPIDIAYFGLMPWLTGQGVGRWLLAEAIAAARAAGATSVTLNTCSLDHPSALPNYLARGFVVVRTEEYAV